MTFTKPFHVVDGYNAELNESDYIVVDYNFLVVAIAATRELAQDMSDALNNDDYKSLTPAALYGLVTALAYHSQV